MARFGLVLLVVVTLAVLPGCGSNQDLPELGKVTGTITFDGSPLAGASVGFEPEHDAAGASTGTTDDTGKYELMFTRDTKGAAVGKHLVRIEMFPDPMNMDGEIQIPVRYNVESELTEEVTPGSNTIDFELTSK